MADGDPGGGGLAVERARTVGGGSPAAKLAWPAAAGCHVMKLTRTARDDCPAVKPAKIHGGRWGVVMREDREEDMRW
jgi:hypothetical protein